MEKILITGARSGIISKVIDNIIDDYELYLTGHTDSQVRVMKDKYKNYKNVTCIKLDITNEDDYRKIENIDIDIYIANAAIAESGSMIEMPVDRIRDNFETNVFCNFNLLQQILHKMIRRGRGKVIIMGSLAGRIPMPFLGGVFGK